MVGQQEVQPLLIQIQTDQQTEADAAIIQTQIQITQEPIAVPTVIQAEAIRKEDHPAAEILEALQLKEALAVDLAAVEVLAVVEALTAVAVVVAEAMAEAEDRAVAVVVADEDNSRCRSYPFLNL